MGVGGVGQVGAAVYERMASTSPHDPAPVSGGAPPRRVRYATLTAR